MKSVASVDDVVYLQKLCKRIYIDPAIKKYIVDIVQATRMTDKILAPELAQYVAMGAEHKSGYCVHGGSKGNRTYKWEKILCS